MRGSVMGSFVRRIVLRVPGELTRVRAIDLRSSRRGSLRRLSAPRRPPGRRTGSTREEELRHRARMTLARRDGVARGRADLPAARRPHGAPCTRRACRHSQCRAVGVWRSPAVDERHCSRRGETPRKLGRTRSRSVGRPRRRPARSGPRSGRRSCRPSSGLLLVVRAVHELDPTPSDPLQLDLKLLRSAGRSHDRSSSSSARCGCERTGEPTRCAAAGELPGCLANVPTGPSELLATACGPRSCLSWVRGRTHVRSTDTCGTAVG